MLRVSTHQATTASSGYSSGCEQSMPTAAVGSGINTVALKKLPTELLQRFCRAECQLSSSKVMLVLNHSRRPSF
jgi:hypothetical protein